MGGVGSLDWSRDRAVAVRVPIGRQLRVGGMGQRAMPLSFTEPTLHQYTIHACLSRVGCGSCGKKRWLGGVPS